MKKFILYFFFTAICIKGLGALHSQTFQKLLGNDGNDLPYGIKFTYDKRYLIYGETNAFIGTNADGYICKVNDDGDTLWTLMVGGNMADRLTDATQTTSGGSLLAGATYSFGAGLSDAWLVNLDTAQHIVWSKTLGGILQDEFTSLKRLHNNDYILAGNTSSFSSSATDFDIFLVKIHPNGDTVWTKSIGTNRSESLLDVSETGDHGYIITGATQNSSGDDDILLVRLDSGANVLWSKTIGTVGYAEVGNTVIELDDGSFMLSSVTHSFGYTEGATWLIRMDATGTILWSKIIGPGVLHSGHDLLSTSLNTFILTGQTHSLLLDTQYVYLCKLNENGDILRTVFYGGHELDEGIGVLETEDHGYILHGRRNDEPTGNIDYYLIRTDTSGMTDCNSYVREIYSADVIPDTETVVLLPRSTATVTYNVFPFSLSMGKVETLCSTVGVENWTNNESAVIYPNPANDYVHIPIINYDKADITDLNGKIINSWRWYENLLDVRCLYNGIYILTFYRNNISYKYKLAIHH